MDINIRKIFVFIAFFETILLDVDSTLISSILNRHQLPSVLVGLEFKLEVRVKIIRDKSSGIDEEISLTEYYSNEQQKAKLKFHNGNQADSLIDGVYNYYDASILSERQLIKVEVPVVGSIACGVIDFKKFGYQLFGALSSYDERLTGEDWLREREDVPDHVIGFARLLYMVESKKDKLVPDDAEVSSEIRNHWTKRYKLEINLSRENPSTIRVSYASSKGESDLPLRILLTLPNGSEVMVDYLAIKSSIEEGEFTLKQIDRIDLFTFPFGEECGSKLKPSAIFSIDRFSTPKVFSLNAEIIYMSHMDHFDYGSIGTVGKYFIAYDGYVKLVRIDSIISTYSYDVKEYSTSIYVPRRNRKFNVRSEIVGQQVTIKDKSSSSNGKKQPKPTANCVSSKISVDGQSQHLFTEPLVPFSRLIRLGRGKVRGVECVIFGTKEGLDLPRIFFPPVSYYKHEKARFVQDNTKQKNDGTKVKYQAIYYFAIQEEQEGLKIPLDNEKQLGPLMRIDLLRSGGGLTYRIETFNFAWTLSDAPNGDRQGELFSLSEKCSNLNSKFEDSYADLAMNLEFKSTVGVDTEIEPDSAEDLKSVIKLLKSPEVRNLALVRAISEDSNLILTQLHEFKSHLHPLLTVAKPKLFIRVEAKLSDPVFDLYEASAIGNGILDSSYVSFARNFEECFWDAAHERKQRPHILFSFCYSVCSIDSRPFKRNPAHYDTNAGFVAKDGNDDNEDGIFLDPTSACEILRMDLKKQDQQTVYLMFKFWTSFYRGLRGLKLLTFVENNQRETRLSFLVNQIDVYNNRWTNLQREPIYKPFSSESNNELLKGLALSLQDRSTKKVRSRNQILDRLGRGKEEDMTSRGRMSFDLCHSSCMADMTCKSYSVCYSNQKLHCLISDLDFRFSELLNRIAKEVEEFKKTNRNRGSINVDFKVNPNEEKDNLMINDKTSEIHELWVDNKCQTYNKYALEMFTIGKMVFSKLRNKYVLSVESENHCAELCLKQNINFFKRIAKFKLKYLESSDQEYLSKVLDRQNIDIRYWCSAFRFLNLATSTLPGSARLNLRPSKLDKNGLCSLVGPNWIKKDDKKEEEKNQDSIWDNKDDLRRNETGYPEQLVAMQSYEFSYNMLYERHYGIKLLPKSDESEYLIDFQLSSNNQTVLNNKQNDIEFCARACFSQTIGLKPWCKSFGYIEDRSVLQKETSKYGKDREQVGSYCVFNSLGLNDILLMKSPETFVDTNFGPDLTVWHFELRNSYTLDDMIASRLVISENLDLYNENGVSRLGTFGITIVLLFSLASGLLFGFFIGSKLIKEHLVSGSRRESVENPSNCFLNSLISGISGDPNEISHRRFEADFDLPDLALEPANKQ